MSIRRFFALMIVIPTIVGLVRYRNLNKEFRLFALIMLLGFLTDLFSILSPTIPIKRGVNYFYDFLNPLLFLQLFRGWGYLVKQKKLFYWVNGGVILLWIFDVLFPLKWLMMDIGQWIWSTYSIVIVLNLISTTAHETMNLGIKKSKLFILMPYLVETLFYVTINLLVGFLYTKQNQPFFVKLYSSFVGVNFFVYMFFAYAFYIFPKREKFLS